MRLSKIDKLTMDGYYFSGIYERSKEKAIEKASRKRKEGHMAKTVFVPSSKYDRGHGVGGYSVYIKPTKKKIIEIQKEKAKKEKAKKDNLKAIKDYLTTRTGVELMEVLKKVLKNDFSGLDGEPELLSWATKEKII